MGPGGWVGGREKGERLPRAVINSYKANKVISRRPATMGRRDAAAWSVQSTLGKQGEVGRAATLSAQSAPRSNLQPLASGCLSTVQGWCLVQSLPPGLSLPPIKVLNQKVLITRCAELSAVLTSGSGAPQTLLPRADCLH